MSPQPCVLGSSTFKVDTLEGLNLHCPEWCLRTRTIEGSVPSLPFPTITKTCHSPYTYYSLRFFRIDPLFIADILAHWLRPSIEAYMLLKLILESRKPRDCFFQCVSSCWHIYRPALLCFSRTGRCVFAGNGRDPDPATSRRPKVQLEIWGLEQSTLTAKRSS